MSLGATYFNLEPRDPQQNVKREAPDLSGIRPLGVGEAERSFYRAGHRSERKGSTETVLLAENSVLPNER